MQANHLIAFKAIVSKEIVRFGRIWTQTIVPPAITTALYFLIFGHLIGSRIGNVGGFNYNQYIAPGLIMMAVINNAYANVCSSFYSAKFQRSIEEMLVSSMPNYIIFAGYVAGGVARGLAVGIVVSVVALFFSGLHVEHSLLIITSVLFTALLFSVAGFINAMLARSFDDISIVPTFILTPLTYLGGVFYSVQLLPTFWRHASLANPILYMVNTFRYGLLGVSDVNIYFALLFMVLCSIVLCWLALAMLNRGVGIRT